MESLSPSQPKMLCSTFFVVFLPSEDKKIPREV